MSFASQAREEIAQRSLQLQKDCCVRAAAYGIACFAKYFDARGLVLQTEQELTARVAEQLFARCGDKLDIYSGEDALTVANLAMGGKGTMVGTMLGALIIAVLRNGFSLLSVSSAVQNLVLGRVIIGAVLLDVTRERMEAKARRLATK